MMLSYQNKCAQLKCTMIMSLLDAERLGNALSRPLRAF